jgi:Protein of unknown function (DUF3500)
MRSAPKETKIWRCLVFLSGLSEQAARDCTLLQARTVDSIHNVGVMKLLRTPLIWLALVVPVAAFSMQRAPAQPTASVTATPRVLNAANAFLATLNDAQRTAGTFAFNGPQRTGWSNLPSPIFQRKGLRLGDLTPAQRAAALGLVSAALSREGYQKVLDIMNGDEVLRNAGGGRTGGRGGGVRFGVDEYYLALLGAPSATAPWLIQFGGHHLAINVTVVGSNNVMTPSLPAAQPARYTMNGQTIRPLGDENDKAFALINALDASQQKQAILNYRVSDLVLGPGEDGKTIQPEGLVGSALNASQQAMLLDVAHEWVGILNDEAASAKMAELKANMPRTYFAWSGDTKNGDLAYYRIQGPTVIIEYAPQQGDLDHIHTIYRDPTNDYGAKLVGK